MLASFAVFLSLASIALPGLGGFPGEFTTLGVFERGWTAAAHAVPLRIIAVASLGGVILGAWYMLGMCRRVFFGPLVEPHHDPKTDTAGERSLGPRGFLSCADCGRHSLDRISAEVFYRSHVPTLDDLMCPAMQAAAETVK